MVIITQNYENLTQLYIFYKTMELYDIKIIQMNNIIII